MTKNEMTLIDYSKLTLQDIIRQKTKRKSSFLKLEIKDQRLVLDYIKNHNINIKVFGLRWFDILSQKFYVIEFIADQEPCGTVKEETHCFDSFSQFYEFLDGDIYKSSCYYGYIFSKQEIDIFNLKISKLNFDSFIKETIDNYSFDILKSANDINIEMSIQKSKEMIEWFNSCEIISSYKDLKKKRNQFVRKFKSEYEDNIFFSCIIRTQKDTIKEPLIEFVCRDDIYCGVTFADILLVYGRDDAIRVIENYTGSCSYSTRCKRIREYKNALKEYDNGTFLLRRKISFKKCCQMYFVEDSYYSNNACQLTLRNCFFSLSELAEFVNNDFRGADLSFAPISTNDLKKYIIDKNTKLPLEKKYTKHIIIKLFDNDEFCVKQIWLDSKDRKIKSTKHSYKIFFDFVHFLKGDLSGTDFLNCNGIKNIKSIKNLKINDIKVRSFVATTLNLPITVIPEERFEVKEFEEPNNFELQTIDQFMAERLDDFDYPDSVKYITDIHLLHKFKTNKCKTYEDVTYVIRTLSKTIGEQSSYITLVGGDTSSDFEMFKEFVRNLNFQSKGNHFFFVLGNHEFWSFKSLSIKDIVNEYKEFLNSNELSGMHLVHNNIFFLTDFGWNEIPTEELLIINQEELRLKMRGARLIIFGGVGFAGKNYEFNANAGLYLNSLSRKEEINESEIFYNLYQKVTDALKGMNVIVLTHMPIKDWGGDIYAKKGVVYVNGHNHKNFFYDDGKKRIYADNQVGYKGKKISLKSLSINFSYNWFADYADGIYEISKQDYEKFYRGIGEELTVNREHEKIYMVKREGTYMFFMKTFKGNLSILNGGSIKKVGNHSLKYFYDNLDKYATSLSMFLYEYDKAQKTISNEIKQIGGDGNIHGAIIDIDYYNHLYLNPLDGTITAYFAHSMIEKYVYDNVPSLLKFECPKLYENYERLLIRNKKSNMLTIYKSKSCISKKRTYVNSTEMYKMSRILRGLQFTTKYNIVRLWNDNFIDECSKENGRLILSGIINPESVPQVVEVKKKKAKISNHLPISTNVFSPEERKEKKLMDYKTKILEVTNTIEVLEYIDSKSKAKYKCSRCGYEWSTRPDHFRYRQKYKCPKCKK